jgi:hypothetical protein
MAGKPKPLNIFVNTDDLYKLAEVTDWKAPFLRKKFKDLLDIEKDIVITESEDLLRVKQALIDINVNFVNR